MHEAFNGTDTTRLILFCDVERPVAGLMSPLNQWMIRNVMKETAAPNEAGEPVGAINRLYSRLATLLATGKELKARNRSLYYLIKNVVIVCAIAMFVIPWP